MEQRKSIATAITLVIVWAISLWLILSYLVMPKIHSPDITAEPGVGLPIPITTTIKAGPGLIIGEQTVEEYIDPETGVKMRKITAPISIEQKGE